MLLQIILTQLVEIMTHDKLHNKYSESAVTLLGCLDDADFTYNLCFREPLPCNLNNGYRPCTKTIFAFVKGDKRLNDEVVEAFAKAGFKWETKENGSTATYYF